MVELLSAYENCNNFSSAIQSVGNTYEPKEEVLESLSMLNFPLHILFLIFIVWVPSFPDVIFIFYVVMKLTDFEKLLDDEVAKVSVNSSSNFANHPIIRQFREAIWVCIFISFSMVQEGPWHPEKNRSESQGTIFPFSYRIGLCNNQPETVKMLKRQYMSSKEEKLLYLFLAISKCLGSILLIFQLQIQFFPILQPISTLFLQNVHHAGQPMAGEEQEDVVMTSTQCNLLNVTCPLSGKPVTELAEPVRRYIATKYIMIKDKELEFFLLLVKKKSAGPSGVLL